MRRTAPHVNTAAIDDVVAHGAPSSPDCSGLALTVVFEDAHLLAIDKPAGLVSHPAYKHPSGTLSDCVFARQAARGEARPWLLHRLDRDTSGVVLFAKTVETRRAVARQFERHTACKLYVAIAAGALPYASGVLDAPLDRDPADRRRTIITPDGQPAFTRFRVLAERSGYLLVLVEPLTGRTHQIRAHLAQAGAPLVGDTRYAPPDDSRYHHAPRTMLHAWRARVRYPAAEMPITLVAPLPPDMLAIIDRLGLEAGASTLLTMP